MELCSHVTDRVQELRLDAEEEEGDGEEDREGERHRSELRGSAVEVLGLVHLDLLALLLHRRRQLHLVVRNHIGHFSCALAALALDHQHCTLLEIFDELSAHMPIHLGPLRGHKSFPFGLVVVWSHNRNALERSCDDSNESAVERLGCCHPADVPASDLGYHLHHNDRIQELVDMWRARENHSASIVQTRHLVGSTNRNFTEENVHHSEPERAHGLAKADILCQIKTDTDHADRLTQHRVSRFGDKEIDSDSRPE
mmetsp:Transcript_6901/g.16266  ORF Transcript_6901/g.16266 Transcript_6901/m.16266 type:complete len:255 (+) Transcript_6901:1646-2410(+)